MTVGGPSKPVINTTTPLAVMGGPARPVHVLTTGAVEAGAAVQLYEVSAAELAERGKSQGDPIKVYVDNTRAVSGGPAIPVYVVTGAFGPGPGPTPPPAPFDPTAYAGLIRWYDYSDTTLMFQDSGQTTPVTANLDPIGSLTDKAAAIEAQQTIDSRRAVYRTGIQNGLSVSRWEDQDEYLLMNTAVDQVGPLYVFVAMNKKSSPATRRQYPIARALSTPHNGLGWDTSGNFEGAASTNFADFVPASSDAVTGLEDNWVILAGAHNGVDRILAFLNGALPFTSGTQNSFVNFNLQAIGTYATSEFYGDIGEVLIYDSDFDYADFQTVAAGLASKWGITWGNSLIPFTVQDEFTTPETNPLADPRTSEPGGQSMDIMDAGGNLSIAGGSIVIAGGTSTFGETGISAPAASRAEGLACAFSFRVNAANTVARLGWDEAAAGTPDREVVLLNSDGTIGIVSTTTTNLPDTYAAATDYKIASILRLTGGGCYHLIKGGAYTDWTLLWPDDQDTTATLYSQFQSFSAAGQLHYFHEMQLGDPWMDPVGIATDEIEGIIPVSAVYNHEADCIIEFVNTTQPTGSDIWWLNFREHTYDTDYYYVITNAAGDLSLRNKTGGGFNTLMTANGVLSGGEVIRVICEGVNITVYYDNTQAFTYGSAWTTGTFGRLRFLDVSTRLDDLIAWPRTIRTDNTMYLRRGGPWRAQDEMPTFVHTTATQDDNGTHEADAIFDFEVTTLPAAQQVYFDFRRADDDNTWRLAVNANGSMNLIERITGGNNYRASAGAGTVSNGDTIQIQFNDLEFLLLVNGTRQIEYRQVTANFLTNTIYYWKQIDNGADIDNLQIWPNYITTGLARQWLEALSP